MREVEVHVHPIDFDAVKAYYLVRGATVRLVPDYTQRWVRVPAPPPRDRYAELD